MSRNLRTRLLIGLASIDLSTCPILARLSSHDYKIQLSQRRETKVWFVNLPGLSHLAWLNLSEFYTGRFQVPSAKVRRDVIRNRMSQV